MKRVTADRKPVKILVGETLKCKGILEKSGVIYFKSLEETEEIT